MDKPMSPLVFRLMVLCYKVRDYFIPRQRILEEVGIEPGDRVLDYGCGTGSYTAVAAQMVGDCGKVYALDFHPLAIESAERLAAGGLGNIEAIRSDCATGLADGSIDVVLLTDILHMLGEPERILRELHRVLKPGGVLACNDHHMKEEAIVAGIAGEGLFRLATRGARICTFTRPE